VPRIAWLVVAVLVTAQLVACQWGSLRADDWMNLERGRLVFSSDWRTIWTTLNPFTLYRPLVDVWHGVMLQLFGLEPRPMLMLLIAQLLLQTWMLARIVRSMGGSRETSALAALAVWAQANTYSWTTLWVSNATGCLMTTCALLALLLMLRAVRLGSEGRGNVWTVAAMNLAVVAAALCKEEAVLLPGIAIALAASRWRYAPSYERRAWMTIGGSMLAVAAGYALFRTQMLSTPQEGDNRYHLRLGPHMLKNLGFLAMHLGALPLVTAVSVSVWMPAAFRREGRALPIWGATRGAVLGGLGWAAVASLLYLPIAGRPAYGYLYVPAFGVAYAVAHAIAFAHQAQLAAGRERSPVAPLAVHAGIALALTAFGLAANGWHRFGALQREALITLRREVPSPPQGALFVFLDPGRKETLSGLSLFSLVFDGTTASMLRASYQRADLQSRVLLADEVDPTTLPPGTYIFRTQGGLLERQPSRP